MKTRQEPGYLVHKIIEQNEKSSVDWREGASGNRSLNIQQEDFDRAGKSDLLQEAKELERADAPCVELQISSSFGQTCIIFG